MIEPHVAAGDARPRTEGDRQEDDREQQVPDAKDDISEARSWPRRSGVAAQAGAARARARLT